MRRWWTIALTLLTACPFGPSASWCAAECASDGRCAVRTERAGDGWYRCYAASDAQCAAATACAARGDCFAAEDGECHPRADVAAHRCATSTECAVWGGCQPRDGFCEPTSDADCRSSLECRTQGRCTHVDHSCQATTAADCAASTGCAIDGLCALQPVLLGARRCGLPEDGDCGPTVACARYGRCVPRPAEGCSDGCRLFYCGVPERPAPIPCTERWAEPACVPSGRCVADDAGRCTSLE